MGQITEDFARQMLQHCKRKEHPPLTVWEAQQLAYAWLERESLREWVRHTGETHDICTQHMLRERCSTCRCGYGSGSDAETVSGS